MTTYTSSLVDCSTATEVDCRDNELGYMFYHNLSGTYDSSILTSGDPDLDLFPALQSHLYWSGTEYSSPAAWIFVFGTGAMTAGGQGISLYTWAVHSGNVGAVPIPASIWLFGSGLLGLVGMARHKKEA